MIFVFGSNRAGIHGAGSAKFALNVKGAIWGKGEGLAGRSYALPTKGYKIEPISLDEIRVHVDRFLFLSRHRKDLTFQVTCVGCGLAGHKHEDIAPMFKNATQNCMFDTFWLPFLGTDKNYWGTF